jgi:hypothetical protein
LKTENDDPSLVDPRMDIELPRCTKFKILFELPNRVCPKQDTVDPNLENARTETALAARKKSRTLA